MSVRKAKAKPLPFAPWPRVWNGGPVEPYGAPELVVEFEAATKSEANERGFWGPANRKKKQTAALVDALSVALVTQPISSSGPWCVRFTRLSRATLDDDNLARAFKALRDQVALVVGIDDGSPCIAFAYAQERRPGEPAVRVEVWGPGARQLPLFAGGPALEPSPKVQPLGTEPHGAEERP